MSSVRKTAVAAAVLWAASAGATAPIDHVDNFALLDSAGKYHDLYYLSDAKAVVLMSTGISAGGSFASFAAGFSLGGGR